MELDKAIKERHSVRNFASKKPDWREIIEAVDAANKCPLAGNISTMKFILVSDPVRIKKLVDASQQDFISKAHYVVVICSDNKQVVRSYNERGKKYASEQAGAAIENFLLKITDLKLASCWVGAFVDNIVREALDIPDDIEVVALLPVGYERGNIKQRRKPNLDNVLYFDEWENEHMKPLKEIPASEI